MNTPDLDDLLSSDETARRREEAIRRARNTPPKPNRNYIGKSAPPKVVLRGGFGIFYDRFQEAQILEANRLNGITQEQFVINNPVCPNLTDFAACTGIVTPATPTTSGDSILYAFLGL